MIFVFFFSFRITFNVTRRPHSKCRGASHSRYTRGTTLLPCVALRKQIRFAFWSIGKCRFAPLKDASVECALQSYGNVSNYVLCLLYVSDTAVAPLDAPFDIAVLCRVISFRDTLSSCRQRRRWRPERRARHCPGTRYAHRRHVTSECCFCFCCCCCECES